MSIVRRKNERATDNGKKFNGAGELKAIKILESIDEMSGKGRLFNHCFLEPGCEIGWHVHNGDGEVYYILSGTGTYSDNGTLIPVSGGDVTMVYSGEGHSLLNSGSETLEFIALILYS